METIGDIAKTLKNACDEFRKHEQRDYAKEKTFQSLDEDALRRFTSINNIYTPIGYGKI